MSILSRIKRVTSGKLELFLSKSENPEVLFPQLISEMEEQVRFATAGEAKALAAVTQAEKALEQNQEKLNKMSSGAESALSNEEEFMAREAVEAVIALEANQIRLEAAVQSATSAFEDARASRKESQVQLQEIRSKKNEILTRARVVQTQEKVQRTVSSPSTANGSILDAVASMEAKIEEREAEVCVRQELAGEGGGTASPSLERRIDTMNRKEEIDRRMAALTEKIKQKVS